MSATASSRAQTKLQLSSSSPSDQVAVADELDRRLSLGDDFLASAGEVGRLLGNAQFISYVIERRQRNLLAVASEILRTMTANRYGFAETFEIVEGQSGHPRPTRTLSGGETFLASLALALALVEIATESPHPGALQADESPQGLIRDGARGAESPAGSCPVHGENRIAGETIRRVCLLSRRQAAPVARWVLGPVPDQTKFPLYRSGNGSHFRSSEFGSCVLAEHQIVDLNVLGS